MATPIAQAFVDVQLNQKAFLSGLAGSQAAFTKATGAMQMRAAATSAAITKSFVAATAGFAALSGVVAMGVKSAAAYEKAWREVWTLMGNTEDQMRSLADATGRMSVKFGQVETTGLKALYQITSAGYIGADAMKVLEESLKGAVGGVSDVFTAADILTGALTAWNAPASQSAHVMDLLFTTIKEGKVTMDSLAAGAGRVMAIAGPFGISMEQTFAALAALSKPLGGVHLAATALVATIRSFLKPTDELAKLLDKWGYATGRTLVEQKGLAGAIAFVKEEAEAAGIPLETLFTNVRAMMGVMPLATTMSEEYSRILDSMGNTAGATSGAVAKMMQSFEMQWSIFRETLNRAKRLFGEAFLPMVTAGLEKIIPYVEKLGEYFRQNGDAVRYFVTHAMKMLGIIVLVGGIAKALKLLMSPVGALIAAAALLYGAWYFNLYGIREIAEKLGETLTKAVVAPLKFVLKLAGADEAAASVETFMGSLNESLVGVVAAMGGFVLGAWLVKGLLGKLGAVVVGATLKLPLLTIAAPLLVDMALSWKHAVDEGGITAFSEALLHTAGPVLGGIIGAALGGVPGAVLGAYVGKTVEVGVELLVNWAFKFDWKNALENAIDTMFTGIEKEIKSSVESRTIWGQPLEMSPDALIVPYIPFLPEGKQVGGPISGTGIGDTIPAMLEPGEFVVPKWMMRIPWLASLISGIWSGAEHFQAGGPTRMEVQGLGVTPVSAMSTEQFKKYIDSLNQAMPALLKGLTGYLAVHAEAREHVVEFTKMLNELFTPLADVDSEFGNLVADTLEQINALEDLTDATGEGATELKSFADRLAEIQLGMIRTKLPELLASMSTGLAEVLAAGKWGELAGLLSEMGTMDSALGAMRDQLERIITGDFDEGIKAQAQALRDALQGMGTGLGETFQEQADRLKREADELAARLAKEAEAAFRAKFEPANVAQIQALAQSTDALIAEAAGLKELHDITISDTDVMDMVVGAKQAYYSQLQTQIEIAKMAGETTEKLEEKLRKAKIAFGDLIETLSDVISRLTLTDLAGGIERLMSEAASKLASAATIGEFNKQLSEITTALSLLDKERLERIFGVGSTWPEEVQNQARMFWEQLVEGSGALYEFGETAKETADRVKREAEEAARAAQEAFRGQFDVPALEALRTGNWMEAAEAIRIFAQTRGDLTSTAAALSDVNGEIIDEAEVLSLITGSYSKLTSNLDSLISVMAIAGEDTAALEEMRLALEEIIDPLGVLKKVIRDITGKAPGAPTEVGSAFRELFEKAMKGETITAAWDDIVKELTLSSESFATIHQAAQDVVSGYEQEIAALEYFGYSTEKTKAQLDEFRATVSGITVEMLHWQDWLEQIRFGELFKRGVALLPEDWQTPVRSFLTALNPSAVDEVVTRLVSSLGEASDSVLSFAEHLNAALKAGDPASWLLVLWDAIDFVSGLIERDVEEARQRLEEAVAKLKEGFTRLADTANSVSEAFFNLARQSEAFSRLQAGFQSLWGSLIDSLFGALWPLVAILESVIGAFKQETSVIQASTEAREKEFEAINVPAGFKGARYEWRAAAPGVPYRPWEEEKPPTPPTPELPEWPTWVNENLEELGKVITPLITIISKFRTGLEEAWSSVIPALVEGLLPVIDTFGWVLGQLSDWIKDTLAPDLSAFFESFGEWWRTDVDPFLRKKVFPTLGEWGTALYNIFKDLVKFFETDIWPFIKGPLWDAFQEGLTHIIHLIGELWEKIKEKWPVIERYILDAFDAWIQSLENQINEAGRVVDAAGRLQAALDPYDLGVYDVQKAFEDVGVSMDSLYEATKDVSSFQDLVDAMKILGLSIQDVSTILLDLGLSASDALAIFDAWSKSTPSAAATGVSAGRIGPGIAAGRPAYGGVIGSTGQWVPYETINGIPVSQLAAGAIITRPTLAMIGEAGPEGVFPLRAFRGLDDLSGGLRTTDITLNLTVKSTLVTDGREIASAVARQEVKREIIGGRY